ncbi:hypothetical protein QN367_15715 [Cryobacterium sp. RTS3]|nr:hypothetical protein [Cryobacterium sp. RTS3]
MDAKRRIVTKAWLVVLVAAILSVTMYGAEIISGFQTQTLPTIGIDPAAALVAVSAFSAVIIGVVLADRAGVGDRRSPPSVDPGEESFHGLASALILADTLVLASVFTAFIGLGALFNAFQQVATWSDSLSSAKSSPSLQNTLLALIVAGIAWVFVLLAAANTKSQSEVRAVAKFEEETYKVAAQRRSSWQSDWMQVNKTGLGHDVLGDAELRRIQAATTPSRNSEFLRVVLSYFILFLAFSYFVFNLGGRVIQVSNPAEFALAYIGAPTGAAVFFTVLGALAYLSLRQALVSSKNRERMSRGLWVGCIFLCLLPSTWAAFIAFGPTLTACAFGLYCLVLSAVWLLALRSKLTPVRVPGLLDRADDRKIAELTGLYYAVSAQLRNFPLPGVPMNLTKRPGDLKLNRRPIRTTFIRLMQDRKSR